MDTSTTTTVAPSTTTTEAPSTTTTTLAPRTTALDVRVKPRLVVITVTDVTPFPSAGDLRRIDNVMFWVDGVLVMQPYDWAHSPFPDDAYTRTQIDANTVRVTLDFDLGFYPLDDGQHDLVVGCFQADTGDIAYLEARFTVQPANVPAVARGVIPRAAFHASPDVLQTATTPLADYVAAGFNCVMCGIFRNPADNSTITTYDQWATWSLAWLKGNLDWCRANNIMFWGTGDDMFRSTEEGTWLATCAWAEQAVRATFALAKDYPEWVAVSMLDETPGLPTDNPLYAQVVQWCREEYGPKLSWPNQRSTRYDPWEDPSIADFADRYYAIDVHTWRDGRYKQGTNWQYALEIGYNASETRTGQAFSFLVSGCGAFYTKQVPGGNYQPGDALKASGITPEQAVINVWLPLAYGASALRVYALDTFWASYRANDPIGKDEQTGLQLQSATGIAMGYAMNAVARYEGALLGGFRVPWKVGNWVVGRRSNGMEFWINTADYPQRLPVDAGVKEIISATGPVAYSWQYVDPGCVVIR